MLSIGVVIPAFNAAPWIGSCLRSLLAQSHAGWHAMVVDDGSADDTAAAAARVADPRIRLERQPNAGVSAARNRGLAALAGTDAVLFLDADDWLAPDALFRLAAALEASPGAVAAVGPAGFVAAEGGRVLTAKRPAHGDVLQRLLTRNLFVNGGHLLIRRAAVGTFVDGLRYGEDWEYWVRLALRGPFARVAGRAPVLLVRRMACGAYARMAGDPASFVPCMAAIFGNPALHMRLGDAGLARARARAEAENDWVVGRALLAQARLEGLRFLRRSAAARPSVKRLGLLAAAHCPPAWRALAG